MSQAKAQDNICKLKAYLATTNALPARNGKLSVSAVATAADIERQVLYRNPTAKSLLETAVREKGLIGIGAQNSSGRSDIEKVQERKIRSLEARNAVLAGENADLRARLRKFEHIEDMTILGRRVIP
tara:strand:+ start:4773 stop:5153 length:381 start_codon:yes stop_codon:yes gene_type:complete